MSATQASEVRIRRLLLVSLEDPENHLSWSGTPYGLKRGLEKNVDELLVLSRLPVKKTLSHGLVRLVLGGKPPRYPLWMTIPALRSFGRQLDAAVDELKPDAVLSISSQPLIYFKNSRGIPVGMFSDVPWGMWLDTYKDYDRPPLLATRYMKQEKKMAQRCDRLFFGTDWACRGAIERYGCEPGKVVTASLGAVWKSELSDDELRMKVRERRRDRMDLLFIGKDWERKGGPVALAILKMLLQIGVPAHLHVVGCNPKIPQDLSDVVDVHGLLSKNRPEQASLLTSLFWGCAFLVVPTLAECFGLVFAEAAAYGLPAVSHRIDAIPSVVLDDKTGFLLGVGEDVLSISEKMKAAWENEEQYVAMADLALQRYRQILNFDSSAKIILNELSKVVAVQ